MQIDFYSQDNYQSNFFTDRTGKSDLSEATEYRNNSHSQFSPSLSEAQIRSFIKEKIAQGNYAVAIALIDDLIARYPNNAIDYNNRGLMYFHNNQLLEAVDDLTHALKINPNLDSAYNNRANCYVAQGNLIAAVSDYNEALDLNPANLRARINQGITFRELGFYDLALENFEIVLIVGNTLQARAYAERGRTHHLRGDWNCAVADYQTALKLLDRESKSENYRVRETPHYKAVRPRTDMGGVSCKDESGKTPRNGSRYPSSRRKRYAPVVEARTKTDKASSDFVKVKGWLDDLLNPIMTF